MEMAMADAREFEVIHLRYHWPYGRLIAERLLKTYGASGNLAWAMAERSAA